MGKVSIDTIQIKDKFAGTMSKLHVYLISYPKCLFATVILTFGIQCSRAEQQRAIETYVFVKKTYTIILNVYTGLAM